MLMNHETNPWQKCFQQNHINHKNPILFKIREFSGGICLAVIQKTQQLPFLLKLLF